MGNVLQLLWKAICLLPFSQESLMTTTENPQSSPRQMGTGQNAGRGSHSERGHWVPSLEQVRMRTVKGRGLGTVPQCHKAVTLEWFFSTHSPISIALTGGPKYREKSFTKSSQAWSASLTEAKVTSFPRWHPRKGRSIQQGTRHALRKRKLYIYEAKSNKYLL